MAKKHTGFLITLHFVALFLSGIRSRAEEPLPFPDEGESRSTLEWKRAAADSALRIGLSSIAVSLYEQLLNKVGEDDEDRDELALGLATAQLSEGRFAEAGVILANLKENDSPRVRLRRALLAHHRKDALAVSHELKGISEEHLPLEERGWFYLLSGISMLGGKDRAMAQNFFDDATKLAVSEAQRTEFLVLLFRAKIESGNADEVLRVKLKNEWERFKNESAGFNFAIEYASVLQALDRPKEAIAVIEAQLKALSGQHSEKKPDLLLALGLLIQDPDSKRGGEALEELVEQADNPVLANAGLRILASRFDPQKANGAYIAFIDRLLASTDPHPLRENLLLVRAHAALGIGADKKVEECCLRLMQEFPASPWKLDALKALATTAWRTNPPKYRIAANYLNDIRAAEEELGLNVNATALLLADCHFLNKDYENARSAYKNLLATDISLEVRSKALFQYVQSLIELGHLEQAAERLDNNDFDSERLSSWWRAEWNLVAALKESSGTAKAFARVRHTLKTEDEKLPEAAKIRLMWLQAQLSLDLKEVQSTPALVDKVMSMLEDNTTLDKDQYDTIKAQTMLTKGQALLRLKKVDESFAVFETIRSQYPKSKQAALSYLLEANHHSVNNHLAEAQRNLVTLAERFPRSEYAPRALYEASINAERRGLPESLQEAVRLLEVLATRFPTSDLLFYARLRQGHMLRNLDDYGAALEVYEEILRNEIFSQHPDRALASLSRADCLFAIARTDSAKILEAAERYGDLFTLGSLPMDLRVEAGCKRALCLRKTNKVGSAKAACWEIIQRFVESNDSFGKLGGKGRYWVSRTIFELGEMLERESSSKQAFEVYALIRKHGLPGEALATARTGSGKD